MSNLAVSSPAAMNAKSAILKVIQGPNKGDTYRIQPPGAVIGRDPQTCQIALNDDRVSRQQCRIDFKFNGVFVEDISGKGTTFVNLQSVATQILASGDQLGFGDTIFEIKFEDAQPLSVVPPGFTPTALPHAGIPTQGDFGLDNAQTGPNKRLILWLVVGALVAGLIYYGTRKTVAKPPSKIAAPDVINTAIEAAQKRQEELRKPRENESSQEAYNRRSAEKYYSKGFRDFQAKSYTRAIESFQTALAVQPHYIEAKRYLKLAEKRRQDLIDAHMDLGNKYKAKSMYKMCIAEFEKVLQIVNRPEDKKYQLAKEQIQECRLLQQGTD